MTKPLLCSDLCPSLTPIVAIHGSASSGALWRPLAQQFGRDRVVIAPDLKGYGKDDPKGFDLNSTLALRAEPVIEAINCLQEKIHLVAHSFGASIVLQILKTLPERVLSVTCYEPVVPSLLQDSGAPGDLELLGDLLALSDVVRGTDAGVGMETFVNFWSEPNAWQKLPNRVKRKFEAMAPVVYQDFLEAYFNLESEAFKTIVYHCPLKIFLGSQANAHAKRMTALFLEQFPQARMEVLSGMGHMGPLTHPGIVQLSIMDHVEQVEANSLKIYPLTQS